MLYRGRWRANDNTRGLHLMSMPQRARAIAAVSLPPVAELWEHHAKICEANEARWGGKDSRRRKEPVSALALGGKIMPYSEWK